MDNFQRDSILTFGQFVTGGKDTAANLLIIEAYQGLGSADRSTQIMPLLLVGCSARGIIIAPYICAFGEHAGDMEKRLALFEVEHCSYLFFAAILQQVVKQSRLFFLDQLGHGNGCRDIR